MKSIKIKKWAIPLVLVVVVIAGFVIYTNTREEPDRGDILAEIAETQKGEKIKSIKIKKWAIPLVLVVVVIAGFVFYTNTREEPDHGDILAEIAETQTAFDESPSNTKLAYNLANLHYKAGHFAMAKKILQPFIDAGQTSDAAKLLMSELEYLTGNYGAAEEILLDLKENAGFLTNINTDVKLAMLYYQTNQYNKSHNLLQGLDWLIPHPILEFMKAYRTDKPYQIDWNGTAETVIPFVVTDPLPLLPVEINGQPIWVLIDTGGATFVLDKEIASSLGIEPDTTFMGKGGGGLQMEVGLGRADTLKIGDVTIHSVPVMTTPTQRWSAIYEGDYTLGGIITTGVLKQFLSTIDYHNGQLILRPKAEGGMQALQQELEGQTVTSMPFALASTHMMMAKGQLNGQDDLTFFVDSGLKDDEGAAFATPLQTLNYVGIPVPETSVDPDDLGGLGGQFATGYFPIEELGLGALSQMDLQGVFGGLTADSYWGLGFIKDGLISHNFLRQYDSWTLDFTDMVYYFTE